MSKISLDDAQTFNAFVFTVRNNLVNENGNRLEFTRHKFLARPLMDNTPKQVVRKCGQIGWSTTAIVRAFHLSNFLKANIIYTLPSKSIVKDFVTPKVDPLIANNPVLKRMVGNVDSMGLKSVGDRFIYFRSSWDEASGIAISAHVLISDELDRSNQKAIRTYRTRLDAAKLDRPELGWEWQFSNPTIPGYGVDEGWEESDQKRWMIKCPHCNAWQELLFPDNINFETEEYICSKCMRVITDDDRMNGTWVKTKISDVSGYWVNQMMCTWHSAKKIIDDSKGDQAVFHNFTLGLPYQSKDQSVARSDLIACLVPGENPRVGNAIGVDNGVVKTYVIGNKYGIFRVGTTESWEEIEALRNQYDAVMVIDANPYPTMPKKLAEKYRGKVFIHYYEQDRKGLGIVRWGEGDDRGVVKSDRTKVIDAVVSDILAQDQLFNMTSDELDEYIRHWGHMFRTVEESNKGIKVAVWKHMEDKPDHYAHATVYFKVALLKTLFSDAVIVTPSAPMPKAAPVIRGGEQQAMDLKEVIRRAGRRKTDWRTR
jgi:hypothetical protein